MRMFRRQPVVDRDEPGCGATREVRCEPDGRGGRPDRVRPAVQVEDDAGVVSARGLDVHDRDPAKARGRCRDVGGHRERRHHLLEDDPLLGYVAAEIERRVSQQLVKGVALLLTHLCLFGFADQRFGSPSSSSVRYFGASAIALAMNAPVAASSSAGGASVRCATGTPTSLKNSSWPAGEQRQSSRAGRSKTFRKTCGALAGTLIVSPAVATALTPRNVSSISPSRMVNISSKSCRCGGG